MKGLITTEFFTAILFDVKICIAVVTINHVPTFWYTYDIAAVLSLYAQEVLWSFFLYLGAT